MKLSKLVPKFRFMQRSFHREDFRLLDIGAGNHSAGKTKNLFPNCEYHGVDMALDYNNDPEDFNAMHSFYEMDLTRLQFDKIPDDRFDGIWIVHVIEHLRNGDAVVLELLPKLKNGGYLYVEYPGKKSLTLPSMPGSLNFNDDNTHVRIYSIEELTTLFEANGCRVLEFGTRRSLWFILAMPFRVAKNILTGKKLQGNFFWDLLGFAEYLWVKKL